MKSKSFETGVRFTTSHLQEYDKDSDEHTMIMLSKINDLQTGFFESKDASKRSSTTLKSGITSVGSTSTAPTDDALRAAWLSPEPFVPQALQCAASMGLTSDCGAFKILARHLVSLRLTARLQATQPLWTQVFDLAESIVQYCDDDSHSILHTLVSVYTVLRERRNS